MKTITCKYLSSPTVGGDRPQRLARVTISPVAGFTQPTDGDMARHAKELASTCHKSLSALRTDAEAAWFESRVTVTPL